MTDHTPISQVSRLEVISTGARRRWTLAEKQRIVAESYSAPRVVSATARRNGLSASQLFTWRRLARAGRLIEAEEAATFAPAIISREASSTSSPSFPERVEGTENLPHSPCPVGVQRARERWAAEEAKKAQQAEKARECDRSALRQSRCAVSFARWR